MKTFGHEPLMSFLKKPFRRWPLANLLALIALTAFVLGAIPRVGCYCADGHYEFFCQGKTVDASGGSCCSCCSTEGRCCQAGACCRRHEDASRGGPSPAGGMITGPECCHWVLSVPCVAKSESENEPLTSKISTTSFVTAGSLPVVAELGASRASHDRAMLPTVNLVIALQRFTI